MLKIQWAYKAYLTRYNKNISAAVQVIQIKLVTRLHFNQRWNVNDSTMLSSCKSNYIDPSLYVLNLLTFSTGNTNCITVA